MHLLTSLRSTCLPCRFEKRAGLAMRKKRNSNESAQTQTIAGVSHRARHFEHADLQKTDLPSMVAAAEVYRSMFGTHICYCIEMSQLSWVALLSFLNLSTGILV